MSEVVIVLGAIGLAVSVLFWFLSGLTNERKKDIDRKLEAYERVHQINISADNSSSDSELSKRVLDQYGED